MPCNGKRVQQGVPGDQRGRDWTWLVPPPLFPPPGSFQLSFLPVPSATQCPSNWGPSAERAEREQRVTTLCPGSGATLGLGKSLACWLWDKVPWFALLTFTFGPTLWKKQVFLAESALSLSSLERGGFSHHQLSYGRLKKSLQSMKSSDTLPRRDK